MNVKHSKIRLAGLTVLFCGWASLLGQIPDQSATVTGRVFDSTGQPLAGARISIFPTGGISGGLPHVVTDQNGNYRFVSPPFGETLLCAVKEAAGYPDTNGLLFSGEVDDRPKVMLSPGSHLQVDFHLGPPDGTVEGTVIDAKTKARVFNSRISLYKAQNPEASYSGTARDGKFLFALPPVPIVVSVSAPGYLPWQYKDTETGVANLTLGRSDHRVLVIELTRGDN